MNEQDIVRFEILEKELEDVPPSNVFNMDETGFHDNS